jgi:hypothetical protein
VREWTSGLEFWGRVPPNGAHVCICLRFSSGAGGERSTGCDLKMDAVFTATSRQIEGPEGGLALVPRGTGPRTWYVGGEVKAFGGFGWERPGSYCDCGGEFRAT